MQISRERAPAGRRPGAKALRGECASQLQCAGRSRWSGQEMMESEAWTIVCTPALALSEVRAVRRF